jgi:tetratricopeptide (TPR) repeat protein
LLATGSFYDMANADDWMAAGLTAYRRGKYVAAAKAAKRALKMNSSASAWLLLGQALVKLDTPVGANHALLQAVRLEPPSLATAKSAAQLWLAMEQPSQVIDTLGPLIKSHCTDDELWRLWERAIRKEQQFCVIEPAIIERARAFPSNISLQRRAGQYLLRRGLGEAAPFLERAAPGDTETTWQWAEALALRDPPACICLVKQHIEVDPIRALKLLVRAGDMHSALEVARSNAGLESWVAKLELWSGSPDRAAESEDPAVMAAHALVMGSYERVIQLLPDPSTPEQLIMVGEAMRHLGRNREASQYLDRAILFPKSGYNLSAHLNSVLIHSGHLLDAELKELLEMVRPMGCSGRSDKVFEEALRLLSGNRTCTPTWLDHGVWRRLRHREGARHSMVGVNGLLHLMPFDEVIGRAAAACPAGHPLMLTYRAEMLLWCGRYDDALRDCEAALDISPKVRWAYFGKASAHLCREEPQLALNTLDASNRVLTPLPNSLSLRGEAHLRLGQPHIAIPFFERAVAARPSRLSALIGLALAQLRGEVDASQSIDAIRRAAPVFWKHAELDLEGEDKGPGSVLEALLKMARGNRSSGTLTYFRDCGTAYLVNG